MSPEEFLKLFEDQAVRYGQASAEIREASGAMRVVADEVKVCNEVRLKGSTFPQMEDAFPQRSNLEGQEAGNRHAARSQDARTALLKGLVLPKSKVSR